MGKSVYMIVGKKSNNVEYPTESAAQIAMHEEMQETGEPNAVGKVYSLTYAASFTCEIIELPT